MKGASPMQLLRYAAGIYAIGLTVHTADHLRRGLGVVTHHVFWAGNVSTVIGVTAVVLIFMGHRLAPLAAVWAGFPIAVGVAAVHLLPQWSTALSDPFPGGAVNGVGPLSWFAVLVEVAGAAAVGVLGWRMLRETWAARPVVTLR
jgi:hypothetical protein